MAGVTKLARPPITRLQADLAAGGLGHVLRHIGRKLASPLVEWGRLGFYACDLDSTPPFPPVAAGLDLRQASAADLHRLVYPGRSATAESLAERFRQGHLCFVALDGRDLAAHARWVATGHAYIPELDADVVLAADEGYMYDGYTRPDARGAGIDGAIRCLIFRSLRDAGFRRVCSYVRADNPVGIRAARRWQRPTGAVRYLKVRGCRPLLRSMGAEPPRLGRAHDHDDDARQRAERAEALRAWFRSWLSAPLESRSTGYASLPEAHFASTALHVVETLGLDASTDRVLDVGCDSAMVTRRVAPHCRKLVGVDFMPELLLDARRAGALPPGNAAFAAADGRHLPFAGGLFTKVYCVGVVHCLPSREDGLAMIKDLVRVCAPGGRVLVGGIPDHAKRWVRRLDLWKENGWGLRARLLAALVVPSRLKPALRRLGLGRAEGPTFLDYDLAELTRLLASPTLRVEVRPFPDSYWNRDFRRTRSNLLLTKMAEPLGTL